MSETSGCGVSIGAVQNTEFGFADDAVIFEQTTKVPAEALEWLGEEAEPLGFRVSSIKTSRVRP